MMMMNDNNNYNTTAASFLKQPLCVSYEYGIFAPTLQILKFPLEVVVWYSTFILDNSR